MTFDEVLGQVIDLLQREGRISYRALKIWFNLDDEYIAELKDELIDAKHLASDEHGTVLVWVGKKTKKQTAKRRNGDWQVPPRARGERARHPGRWHRY
jgi:hypothetical protein